MLVIHSMTLSGLGCRRRATQADLSSGRPLRPEAWCRLLEQSGYEALAQRGPDGADFLVTAVRADLVTPYTPAER